MKPSTPMGPKKLKFLETAGDANTFQYGINAQNMRKELMNK